MLHLLPPRLLHQLLDLHLVRRLHRQQQMEWFRYNPTLCERRPPSSNPGISAQNRTPEGARLSPRRPGVYAGKPLRAVPSAGPPPLLLPLPPPLRAAEPLSARGHLPHEPPEHLIEFQCAKGHARDAAVRYGAMGGEMYASRVARSHLRAARSSWPAALPAQQRLPHAAPPALPP